MVVTPWQWTWWLFCLHQHGRIGLGRRRREAGPDLDWQWPPGPFCCNSQIPSWLDPSASSARLCFFKRWWSSSFWSDCGSCWTCRMSSYGPTSQSSCTPCPSWPGIGYRGNRPMSPCLPAFFMDTSRFPMKLPSHFMSLWGVWSPPPPPPTPGCRHRTESSCCTSRTWWYPCKFACGGVPLCLLDGNSRGTRETTSPYNGLSYLFHPNRK